MQVCAVIYAICAYGLTLNYNLLTNLYAVLFIDNSVIFSTAQWIQSLHLIFPIYITAFFLLWHQHLERTACLQTMHCKEFIQSATEWYEVFLLEFHYDLAITTSSVPKYRSYKILVCNSINSITYKKCIWLFRQTTGVNLPWKYLSRGGENFRHDAYRQHFSGGLWDLRHHFDSSFNRPFGKFWEIGPTRHSRWSHVSRFGYIRHGGDHSTVSVYNHIPLRLCGLERRFRIRTPFDCSYNSHVEY